MNVLYLYTAPLQAIMTHFTFRHILQTDFFILNLTSTFQRNYYKTNNAKEWNFVWC